MLKKILLVMTLCVSVFSFSGCVTIVKNGEENLLTGEQDSNSGDDLKSMWESSVIPSLEENAIDINEFLTSSNGDFYALANQHGKYSMGDSGELSYVVKGKGTVKSVETEKKAGYMEIQLDDYLGTENVKIQIGTVFKGSAVRDSVDFISFEDYKNQVDYAAVSQTLHNIVQEEIIMPIGINSCDGKEIEFLGCFTVSNNEELLITPVILRVN